MLRFVSCFRRSLLAITQDTYQTADDVVWLCSEGGVSLRRVYKLSWTSTPEGKNLFILLPRPYGPYWTKCAPIVSLFPMIWYPLLVRAGQLKWTCLRAFHHSLTSLLLTAQAWLEVDRKSALRSDSRHDCQYALSLRNFY